MGVTGSYCQLCRLPLQHDHYVPTAPMGMLKIYRSSRPDGGHVWEPGERVVRFTDEHAWLLDAVALTIEDTPRVVAGAVEDGSLDDASGESHFIWEGDDEAVAFHRYCYELIGSPTTHDAVLTGHGTHAWAMIEPYRGQLFAMRDFVDHGKGWALVDPRLDTAAGRRSRARIATLLAQARRPPPPERASTVAEVLASDRGWRGHMMRDDAREPSHVVRHRHDLHPELDCAAYPALVWAMKEYGGEGMADAATLDELETYEVGLKAAVEAAGAAILIMTTIGNGQAQFVIQARDEAATRAAIEALPSGDRTEPIEFDNETDPAWKVYFEQMDPRRHRR